MLTASVENMLVTSIGTTLETGFVPMQYIVIISTVRGHSEVGIQRWIDVGRIVNFCLGSETVSISVDTYHRYDFLIIKINCPYLVITTTLFYSHENSTF